MFCIKCNKNNTFVNKFKLCKACYSKMHYNKISLQDLLSNNYVDHRKVVKNFTYNKLPADKLISDYYNVILSKKVRVIDYCKQNNISRQALYKRIDLYKKKNLIDNYRCELYHKNNLELINIILNSRQEIEALKEENKNLKDINYILKIENKE